MCNLICAGLVIEDLMDGGLTEPPTEPPLDNSPQTANPHMNNEEGMHLNTFRYGKDNRVMPDVVEEEKLSTSKKYDGS